MTGDYISERVNPMKSLLFIAALVKSEVDVCRCICHTQLGLQTQLDLYKDKPEHAILTTTVYIATL